MSPFSEDGSLYERLVQYSQSDIYPFHMPGHKRRHVEWKDPFSWDITEIGGFDDLHHPQGILQEAMRRTAALYGSDASYFLVNGSSCGVLAAISACTTFGGKILMARNCHQSAYYGVHLNQLEAIYLCPEQLEFFGCFSAVDPEAVEEAFRDNQDIQAMVITSPTYEGIVSDIPSIAEISHRYHVPLIVDEAHGAHFSFHEYFPMSALAQGADIVIQSLHKTLPSLTQTALLHVKGRRVDQRRVQRFLSIYQSSSPSYVLMASIDQCVRYMSSPEGRKKMDEYVGLLEKLRGRLKRLERLYLLDEADLTDPFFKGDADLWDGDGKRDEEKGKNAGEKRKKQTGGKDDMPSCGKKRIDRGKLVIGCRNSGINGQALYKILLEKYRLQPEMAGEYAVILMTSLNDSEKGFFRLVQALEEIDQRLLKQNRQQMRVGVRAKRGSVGTGMEEKRPAVKWKIGEALERPMKYETLEKSIKQICGEFIYLYPPGIPLLVPGEQISEGAVKKIQSYLENGLEVHGLEEDGGKKIPVICP